MHGQQNIKKKKHTLANRSLLLWFLLEWLPAAVAEISSIKTSCF